MNKKVLLVFLVISLGLSLAVYQYAKELQADLASAAYSTSKPANGHSWSEMECSSGLCVTSGNNVGIGTDNPSKKLSVVGDINASGDICNGTGNCLSALATLTNACGGAATTYVYSATAYSGTYCVMGSPTPATPAFPAVGSTTTWTCPVTSGSPISCTATHALAPVDGACGTAATTYVYSATAYSGTYCSVGTASPTTPAFPAVGGSSNWSCLGTNGGASPSCTASRSNPASLVNFAHTEANCTAAGGTVVASGVTYNQCKFNGGSCPSGWSRYSNWSTTATATGTATAAKPAETTTVCSCPISAGGHGWSDSGTTSVTVCAHLWWYNNGEDGSYACGCNGSSSNYLPPNYEAATGCGSATSSTTQVGCY